MLQLHPPGHQAGQPLAGPRGARQAVRLWPLQARGCEPAAHTLRGGGVQRREVPYRVYIDRGQDVSGCIGYGVIWGREVSGYIIGQARLPYLWKTLILRFLAARFPLKSRGLSKNNNPIGKRIDDNW